MTSTTTTTMMTMMSEDQLIFWLFMGIFGVMSIIKTRKRYQANQLKSNPSIQVTSFFKQEILNVIKHISSLDRLISQIQRPGMTAEITRSILNRNDANSSLDFPKRIIQHLTTKINATRSSSHQKQAVKRRRVQHKTTRHV